MSEPERGAGGGAERGASRRDSLTAFLTSGPALIGAFAALITAITGLIIGLNQIGVIGGDNGDADDGATPAATDTPPTTTEEATGAAAYFRPMTSPLGRVYFEDETMLVTATTPNRPLVRPADLEEPLRDVRMSVRARWVSGARSYGAGLICRYENANNYYLLAVFSGGGYNVVKYTGGKPRSLARESPESSDESDDEDDVEARCVGDDPTSLTLIVDGDEVATVQDPDGIESGVVGVRVGTDEARVTVGFEDFVLRSL
jgi:hypothetical protein